jgi:hypothetical protein
MTIIEFALLRAGYTPAELNLPDSVLDGAGSRPLRDVTEKLGTPLYWATFSKGRLYVRARARRAQAKGATA